MEFVETYETPGLLRKVSWQGRNIEEEWWKRLIEENESRKFRFLDCASPQPHYERILGISLIIIRVYIFIVRRASTAHRC